MRDAVSGKQEMRPPGNPQKHVGYWEGIAAFYSDEHVCPYQKGHHERYWWWRGYLQARFPCPKPGAISSSR